MTIYLDRVFALNFLVDALLLSATAHIGGIPRRRGRLLLCALSGASYAAAVYLPQLDVLAHPVIRIGAGALLGVAAFWPERKRLRLTAVFLLLSGTLAGVVLALGLAAGDAGRYAFRLHAAQISWPLLLGSTAVFYGVLRLFFRRGLRHEGGEIMEVTVRIGGKERRVLALYDTGNTLCDPVSGEAVLVLEQSAVRDLWPADVREILENRAPPEEKMARLHRESAGTSFSLLPFRSVGVPEGLLLAYRSDSITVGGRRHRRALLALSEGPLSDGGAYQALWGGERSGLHASKDTEAAAASAQLERAV